MRNSSLLLSAVLLFPPDCLAVNGPDDNTTNGSERAISLECALVSMTVTVSDKLGRCITGLEQSRFEIYDDRVRQEIAFFTADDAPATIGIIADLSGSMSERMPQMAGALRRLLETCHSDDEYFVLSYNSSVGLVQDFTPSAGTAFNSLSLTAPSGRTALYDAVYLGLQKARDGRHARRVLILVSDGQDNASRFTFRELEREAREADVTVYSIGIVTSHDVQTFGTYPIDVLRQVASVTGGRAFFLSSDEGLHAAFAQIALEMRSRYSIGFYPSEPAQSGEFRKLRVKVSPPPGSPALSARTRDGYVGE